METIMKGAQVQSERALQYFELPIYPLRAPDHAKYIIAQNEKGEEYLIAVSLRDYPNDLYHDDILREARLVLGKTLRCIGGGRLKPGEHGEWFVTGKSTVFGEDLDKERTAATFTQHFKGTRFIVG